MKIKTFQCYVMQSWMRREKGYDVISRVFVSKVKWWIVRVGEDWRSELKEGIIESKESQVHWSGEINALDLGVVDVRRCRSGGDERKRREKWWLTAGVDVEGEVEIKTRDKAITWRRLEQQWKTS